MKVMKFGGTSVGTPQRMKEVTQLVTKSGEPVFVVLSAMSGTTRQGLRPYRADSEREGVQFFSIFLHLYPQASL